MIAIEVTLEEALLVRLDDAARYLNISRTAFVSDALEMALRRGLIKKLEAQHELGYMLKPPAVDGFGEWENDQVWPNG